MTEPDHVADASASERGLTTSCARPERNNDPVPIAPSSLDKPPRNPATSSRLVEAEPKPTPDPEPASVQPIPRPAARRSLVRSAIRHVSLSSCTWSQHPAAGDMASAQRMEGAVDGDTVARTQCTRDETRLVASPAVPLKSRASWFGCLAWSDDHAVPAQALAPVRITLTVPLAGTDPTVVAGGPGTDMGRNAVSATPPPAADLIATPPLTPDLLPTPRSVPGPLLASQLPNNPPATPPQTPTSPLPFPHRNSRTFRKTHARAYSLPGATSSSQDTPAHMEAGRARGGTVGGRRRTRTSFRESWRPNLQLGSMSMFASTSTRKDNSFAGWRRSYPASPAPSPSALRFASPSSSTPVPSPSTAGSSRRAWSWSPVTRMPSFRHPSPSSTHNNPAPSPTHTAALSPHHLSDTFANRRSRTVPKRHRRALSLLTGLSLSRSTGGTSGSSGLVSSRSTSTISSFGHDGDPGGGDVDDDDDDGGDSDVDEGDMEQPTHSLSD